MPSLREAKSRPRKIEDTVDAVEGDRGRRKPPPRETEIAAEGNQDQGNLRRGRD